MPIHELRVHPIDVQLSKNVKIWTENDIEESRTIGFTVIWVHQSLNVVQ